MAVEDVRMSTSRIEDMMKDVNSEDQGSRIEDVRMSTVTEERCDLAPPPPSPPVTTFY